jgi:hypothetical protein
VDLRPSSSAGYEQTPGGYLCTIFGKEPVNVFWLLFLLAFFRSFVSGLAVLLALGLQDNYHSGPRCHCLVGFSRAHISRLSRTKSSGLRRRGMGMIE